MAELFFSLINPGEVEGTMCVKYHVLRRLDDVADLVQRNPSEDPSHYVGIKLWDMPWAGSPSLPPWFELEQEFTPF